MDQDWLDLGQLIEQVQEYLDVGLHDEAIQLLDNYSGIYNDEWELHYLYSRILSEQNQPQKSIEHLEQGLKIDKDNLDCLLGLFYSYNQMEQMHKGVKSLRRAQQVHPRNELVLNALIWYNTEICDFSKAIALYEGARGTLDANPEALRNTGIAYERFGNVEKAQECFEKALELHPQFDEVRDLLADQYMLHGNTDKAIDLYRAYLKDSPNNVRALSRLAFCMSQNEQSDEAETIARETVELYPNSPVGYVDLAYVHLNAGRPDQSIAFADKAIDVAPLDAEAWRVKGIANTELEDHEKAEIAFQKAISLDPQNPEIMRDYYHFLREVNRDHDMKNLVHKIIKQEKPYCMEDYCFLADYYQEKDQSIKSFHYLRKAYESMPGEKDLIPPMVDILLNRNHTAYALPFLSRYVESMGWNDIMDNLSHHKRLKSLRMQEGLRFLRYRGQKPRAFREFLFGLYFRKFIWFAAIIIATLFFAISAAVVDLVASAIACAAFFATIGAYKLIRSWLTNRAAHIDTL